jgi:hypothetical protein
MVLTLRRWCQTWDGLSVSSVTILSLRRSLCLEYNIVAQKTMATTLRQRRQALGSSPIWNTIPSPWRQQPRCQDNTVAQRTMASTSRWWHQTQNSLPTSSTSLLPKRQWLQRWEDGAKLNRVLPSWNMTPSPKNCSKDNGPNVETMASTSSSITSPLPRIQHHLSKADGLGVETTTPPRAWQCQAQDNANVPGLADSSTAFVRTVSIPQEWHPQPWGNIPAWRTMGTSVLTVAQYSVIHSTIRLWRVSSNFYITIYYP